MHDLFSHQGERVRRSIAPLADRLRPESLEDFVGQEAILGPGRLLRRAIAADRVGNLILHGPPGTGKTTLARIIANTTQAHFSGLNAVLAGVKDLRAKVDDARRRLDQHGLLTTLFIDEVHRFNTAQQDALLPWVENGTLRIIGATTENPYFEVNKALVSRSRLFRLQPLEPSHLHRLLKRALSDREKGFGQRSVRLSQEASDHFVNVASGDARSMLNALELAVETTPEDPSGTIAIDLAIAEESIQERAVLYDKQGDAHFDTVSAFIKSLRGSDADAALFWLARMVEAGENPRFIFRRMLISAGEDIGLADPQAVVVVEACASAFDRVGLPEGLYLLAHAALYLAGTEKSNSSMGIFDALRTVRHANHQQVPSHLRDSNRDEKAFGDGVGYRYPHAYSEHWVAQQYLPTALQGEVFWQPGSLGWEGVLRLRLQQRRAAQLAAAAETDLDQPEQLSRSPEDPLLDRWLRRQAASEGERLDQLRQRFWKDSSIKRLDRVLVLDGRSLLWALDPLQAASEGEVVITLALKETKQRLEGQLQILDQLRRPHLLLISNHDPEQLVTGLELAPGEEERFEWLVARQPFRNCSRESIEAWLDLLTRLAAHSGQARFLFSQPLRGPAASLLQQLNTRISRRDQISNTRDPKTGPVDLHTLQRLVPLETGWLKNSAPDAGSVATHLERRGWQVQTETWQESVQIPIAGNLLERWFGAKADYRHHLEQHLETGEIAGLEALFRLNKATTLPLPLVHTLLVARRV